MLKKNNFENKENQKQKKLIGQSSNNYTLKIKITSRNLILKKKKKKLVSIF